MSGEFIRENVPDWPAYADREGLALVGKGKWRNTLCAFHDDTNPSMRVNTASGGWCCMSCGVSGGDTLGHYMQLHGTEFIDAARALGAWKAGDAPARPRRPRALSANDALELLYQDAHVMYVVSQDIAQGKALNADDLRALGAAYRRVLVVYDGVRAA